MKDRIVTILTLIITGCLIEFGLAGVFVDTAFRGNSQMIQSIAFFLIFYFPLFLTLGFHKKLTKIIVFGAIIIAILCMIYHFSAYGLKMINLDEMTIITFGFFVTIILLSRLLIIKKKTIPEKAFE